MPSLKDMRGKAKEAGLMKLDKLIATRQRIPDCTFPVPVKELCERYEKLYTGCINDVMRELCLLNQNLPSDIMPLRDEMTVCGEAFTVKSAPNVMIEGEMTFRAQMLDDFKPEGVVVWDTSEDTEASLWGGVMTATAITKGIRGAVIAGGIRDTRQILEQKFPVFYKYRTSNGSLGRCMITHYQVPVRIGKVTVRPGDIIFGDIDGVLCIPPTASSASRAKSPMTFSCAPKASNATRSTSSPGSGRATPFPKSSTRAVISEEKVRGCGFLPKRERKRHVGAIFQSERENGACHRIEPGNRPFHCNAARGGRSGGLVSCQLPFRGS